MSMPVLMIGEVPNLTEEVYVGMIGQLMPTMRASKGFISHSAGPSPSGGWRVVEAWESEEDSNAWFEANVKPNLPPDIVPNRTHYPLHTAFAK
jgi:heme-degrading monooxygenase HmoA